MESPKSDLPNPQPRKNKTTIFIVAAIVLVCSFLLVVAGRVIIPNLGKFSIPESSGENSYSGIADIELQKEAIKLLEQEEGALGCDTISLVSVEVLNLPEDTIDASWAEVWAMDACGETHSYAITFSPDPAVAGGIKVTVLRIEN